jgi:GNAT superfamily N-acetyltransferase
VPVPVQIEFLADYPQAVHALGQWMHEEWPLPGRSAADRAAAFRHCLNRERVPVTLVAVDQDALAGTVSLLNRSVSTHKHLRPWVASLYVAEPWRHRGVATLLVETAVTIAGRLGVQAVYIGVVASARAHYQRQGWCYLGEGRVDGDPLDRVDVLSRRLY